MESHEQQNLTFKVSGAEVLRRRLALRLSQEKLAARAGLSSSTIGRIEREEHIPDTKTVIAVTAALDCDVVDLLAVDDLRAAAS